MGAFNTLGCDLTCPRCGWRGEMEVEFRLGLRDQIDYRLGDAITWAGGGRRKPLRRPEGGNEEAEGYVECPRCEKALWVTIGIRSDIIATVEVDPTRQGYVP
jgi:hypothetical protein